MSIFKHVARVRLARLQAQSARAAVRPPASALLARGRAHPLVAMGAVAGGGFVLGTFRVRPWRIPGFTALLAGGLGEVMAQAAKWIAAIGAVGVGAAVDANADDGAAEVGSAPP